MQKRLPVAVLTTFFCGCSFVFGGGPPAEHQQMPYFDCPSTFGLPVADGFFATLFTGAAVATFQQSEQEYKDKNKNANRNVAGGIDVATALVFAGSAVYGIVQANRCQAAKEALKARIMEPILRPAPHPAPPPPAPAPPAAPAPTAPPETQPPAPPPG
jgi:hypothetical protein